jgi:hypothetical protein
MPKGPIDPRQDERLMDCTARVWTAKYIAANVWRVQPDMDEDDLWQVAHMAWFRFCPGSRWYTQRDGSEHPGWFRSDRGIASRMQAYKLALVRDVCSLSKGGGKCGVGWTNKVNERAVSTFTDDNVDGSTVVGMFETGTPVSSRLLDDERDWVAPATPPGLDDEEWQILALECPDLVELYRVFVLEGKRPRRFKRTELQEREIERCVDAVLVSRGLRPRLSTVAWLKSVLKGRANASHTDR